MSKINMPSLSSLIPVKGEAARPEVLESTAARDFVGPTKEDRDGFTVRVLRADHSRLKEMAYKQDRKKQSLLDQAIAEFLDRSGY